MATLKEYTEYDAKKEFKVGAKGKAIVTKILEGTRTDFFKNSKFGTPQDVMLQCIAENSEGEPAVVTFKKSLSENSTLNKFLARYKELKAGVEVDTVVDENGKAIIEV